MISMHHLQLSALTMAQTTIQRHYAVPGLNFRDFWDLCSHFQRVHPEFNQVSYTIDGFKTYIVLEESDVSVVLRKLSENKEPIRKYVARFHSNQQGHAHGASELIYRPQPYDDHQAGIYFFSDSVSKLSLYHFERQIYDNYETTEALEPQIEFGKPCEVLAAVIDMRGFSAFCEKPNIESPYTCGLMTSFYHMVRTTFSKYPPELIKFLGDGVIAIWQTNVEDRQVAINNCIEGSTSLHGKWQIIRRSEHFSHGTPAEIAAGISFGLASKLSFGDDYIGRPINIASRLCSVCPGGKIYVDKSVPRIPEEIERKDARVRIKSFGEYNIWTLFGD